MKNLSCVTVKRSSSSDVKWVTLEWLAADWRAQYASWDSSCSRICFSQPLIWGMSYNKVFCELFKFSKDISQSDLYQFWRQANAVRKSCSPTLICLSRQQAQDPWKPQTSSYECGSSWAWLGSFTAWFCSCCWLLCLHVVYGTKLLVVLHCAFKLQQYLSFNFCTACFLFISGCTNLQCNLFTAEATLTQFESWETEAADCCQKKQTNILNILFTKPFYFTHPVLHGRGIRRKLRERIINSTWKGCLSLVTIISPPCSRFFYKI